MTRIGSLVVLMMMTAAAMSAQVCDPPQVHPQVDSEFDYVRSEIEGLRWLRRGAELSHSIPGPAAPDERERSKKAELRSTMVGTLNAYYDCAALAVKPYQESKTSAVRESVELILNGIRSIQEINSQVAETLATVDKADSPQNVDPAMVERLDKSTESEERARAAITLGVKFSTTGLVRTKDGKPGGEAIAFTITAKQHNILATETAQLVRDRTRDSTFVDDCAAMLKSVLAKKLPTVKQ